MKAAERKSDWLRILGGMVTVLLVMTSACGTVASQVLDPASLAEPGESTVTATPAPTPTPGAAASASASASDTMVFVTQGEPASLGSWSVGCTRGVSNAVCGEIASDPFTWIDGANFEIVPLSGVESWSQQAGNRWRFTLRQGVSFHNGEPWNAAAAKTGLDYMGDKATSGHGLETFGFHGVISGEVVDEYTVDVVCEVACPIFPRTAIFTTFQAPEWFGNASDDEQAAMTVGLGPYRVVEHVPGVEVRLESYAGYQANSAYEAQAPAVKTARQVWNPEPLVRAAMTASGEGHWAVDIGFENIHAAPAARTGATNEVLTLVADNIWHPELQKKEVRAALAHGVDCQLLMKVLYDGLLECIGNISQWGTVGINENNFTPYDYSPELSRGLLASSGYYHADYDHETNNYRVNPSILIHTRLDRVYRGLELFETVVTGWRELGVNAEVVVLEPSRARDARRSGCGALQPELQLDCVNQDPPGVGSSTHYYETATSNETLDMQRQLLLRASCHSVNSRVCNLVPGPGGTTFQESIADAVGTPLGPDRQRKMEALAQIIRDEYWFLPFFVSVQVYGLAHNLDWEPRYDSRIRLNTMRFTEE